MLDVLGKYLVSPGKRTRTLAEAHPDKTAIVYAAQDRTETSISWNEIEHRSNQVAHLLIEKGADADSMVIVHRGNSPELVISGIAAWKIGACVLPLSPRMPENERDEIVSIAQTVRPAIAIADWATSGIPMIASDLKAANDKPAEPLPDVTPERGKAICSGGSTGRPKIIYDAMPYMVMPMEVLDELPEEVLAKLPPMRMPGMGGSGIVSLVALPMYHSGGWGQAFAGLLNDNTIVLMQRFDAALAVDLIERHRVGHTVLVPTMMQRIARLAGVRDRDFSSLKGLLHGGSLCPDWVKRAWIDLIGPEAVFEAYAGTEGFGGTAISGAGWLEHPGTVGTAMPGCEVRILDEDGKEVPRGEVGEIFFGWPQGRMGAAEYVGSPPAKTTDDGFTSYGDMGWLDDEGYLHLADRRFDMIITGGANVFPAEVESALSEHPEVEDVAVIGLPDEAWGKIVHAIIQPRKIGAMPSIEELDQHCRERLTPYKVPKSYEFVAELPRDQTGKIRRSALVDEAVKRAGEAVKA